MEQRTTEIEPERLPALVAALPGIEALRRAAGATPVYLVGGSVRDLLLGMERADLDVAVEGDVAPIAAGLGGEVRSHERFGTAAVRVDGLELDLAATRAESYAHPGALPEVRAAAIAEDLARRDFSVNAMALALNGPGALLDPHGGVDDLRAGLLRVLHERSFADDPTRALRAARYAARHGFGLEHETARLIRDADLGTVSDDRVRAELLRLAAEPRARRAFELAAEWGLIVLAPGAGELLDGVAQVFDDADWAQVADRAQTLLAVATGRDQAVARELAAAHPVRPSEGVALAGGRDALDLVIARALGARWLDDYVSRWRKVSLAIDGAELLAAGVPEGPAVGRGLQAALRAKLDGEASGREDELRVALAAAREGG
jgi:tRNA nucleotidyltransferase (CCA-adding enzyme)